MDDKSARWEFEEGDEIVPGRYALRPLGGGIRYEAYLAWDDTLYSLVVAKVVRPDRVYDERTLRGLRDEARALQRLNHPVLVRGFDAVLEGPRPHIVLEHLEGPRLSTLLRKYGPLPMEQLLPLGIQLSSALYYMSECRMVHLDVKPRNIIMAAPPRLIDLSIAKSFEDAASLSGAIGTDAYMAPEQTDPRTRGPIGPAADVWGLGAVLFEAVAGYLPFPIPGDDSNGPRWPQLHADPYDLPENIPDALVKPIMSALAPDPAARPRADEIAGMLQPLVAALPRKPVINRLRPKWRD
jgi:eukaryotic-like serine/threonine-protein kinase